MALYKMTTHSRTRRNGTLEVHGAVLFEGAEICTAQGFRGNADSKGRDFERGYGKTGAIYADAITKVAVGEDLGGIRDDECCAAIGGLEIEF